MDEHLPWLQVRLPDVQAAAEVLGRRPDPDATWTLYLSRVDIRGVQLDGAALTDTQLRHANLARAWLRAITLDHSDLKDTDLRRAILAEASLVNVNLAGAYLDGADLRRAELRGADLRGADIRALHLREAVLTGARAPGPTQAQSGPLTSMPKNGNGTASWRPDPRSAVRIGPPTDTLRPA